MKIEIIRVEKNEIALTFGHTAILMYESDLDKLKNEIIQFREIK